MKPLWIKAALLLVLVWVVAAGAIWWARNTKITPEKVRAYVEANPIASAAPAKRAGIIEDVADKMNRLTYEDRREFRMGRKLDGFFKELTPEERSRFLDLTLPTGFKQMMEEFNKMDPQRRRRMVARAVDELKKNAADGTTPPELNDPNIQKIMNQGMSSFMKDANVDVKMDAAPFLEQLQQNMRWGR